MQNNSSSKRSGGRESGRRFRSPNTEFFVYAPKHFVLCCRISHYVLDDGGRQIPHMQASLHKGATWLVALFFVYAPKHYMPRCCISHFVRRCIILHYVLRCRISHYVLDDGGRQIPPYASKLAYGGYLARRIHKKQEMPPAFESAVDGT